MKTHTKNKPDFYQQITNQIIEALESGVKPWVCPWDKTEQSGMPSNASTGAEYNGMNIMLLWMSATMQSFSSSFWMTFKQAKAKGGQVRKGEKGTHIFFYNMIEKTDKGTDEVERYAMLKTYSVFNIDQIDGLPESMHCPVVATNDEDPIRSLEHVERFLHATGANIVYNGQRAFYRPSTDEIVIPDLHRFSTTEDAYATTLHELTHWTGHKSRLERKNGNAFGSKDYAFEELIAELGSVFLMADLGIVGEVQHESYIANWLTALKDDKRYIFKAASQASKAHQFLRNVVDHHNADKAA
ncbi:ArdC family protein [Aliivibrio salmonicida]|uniref:ArdC family protein n=1 Tax=Aliivibrio salmonicida TaxID=40269 RepID=UPI003D123878